MGPGQHVLCTYTNTHKQGTLEVVKHYSGTAGKVNLLIDGGEAIVTTQPIQRELPALLP